MNLAGTEPPLGWMDMNEAAAVMQGKMALLLSAFQSDMDAIGTLIYIINVTKTYFIITSCGSLHADMDTNCKNY